MRYGLALPTGGECGDPRFLVELAERAEAAGWDGVFLEDYVCYQGDPRIPTCDTWVALAGMAMRTTSVRLGVEVVALPRRRPWIVAREAAAVDQLSEGRLIVGFGIGDKGDPGFGRFGEETGADVRAARLDEGLAIVAGLWTGEPFSYRGDHFSVEDVAFRPTPVQRPRPEIWIGGGYPNEGAIERALRWDGACMYRRAGGHLVAEDVRDLRARAGDRPWTIAVGGQQRRDDWDEELEQIRGVEAEGADWWVEWAPPADRDTMVGVTGRGPIRA